MTRYKNVIVIAVHDKIQNSIESNIPVKRLGDNLLRSG